MRSSWSVALAALVACRVSDVHFTDGDGGVHDGAVDSAIDGAIDAPAGSSIDASVDALDGGTTPPIDVTFALAAGQVGGQGNRDGAGTAAFFNRVGQIEIVGGKLLVADGQNGTVRQVTFAGDVSTYQHGFSSAESVRVSPDQQTLYIADSGANMIWMSAAAQNAIPKKWIGSGGMLLDTPVLNGPEDAIVDGNGTVYIANTQADTVLRVGSDGTVVTVSGFNNPIGLALVAPNIIYVADSIRQTIRQVDFSSGSGVVTAIAGATGQPGLTNDGSGGNARFNHPFGLYFDAANHRVLVAERTNNDIRAVSTVAPHAVTTLFSNLVDAHRVASDGTTFYLADASAVRTAGSAGPVTVLAGNLPNAGNGDGLVGTAKLDAARGLAVADDGSIYIAEAGAAGFASNVRRVLGGQTTSCNAAFGSAFGVAVLGSAIYTSDASSGSVFFAATCMDGASTVTTLPGAFGMATDGSAVWVAGGANQMVTEVVGGSSSFTVAGSPQAIAFGSDGVLYTADPAQHVVERNAAVFAGQLGTAGYQDGSDARFDTPSGIAVDQNGNVYVADTGNAVIRKISPGGNTTTIAGAPGDAGIRLGSGSDGRLGEPLELAIQGSDLLVSDQNAVLRLVGVVKP